MARYMYLLFYGEVLNGFDAGNIHYEGHYKGWALKSSLFWALKWQRAQQVLFGPKKVEISGPTPYDGPSIGPGAL
jgi:hypothetical protein